MSTPTDILLVDDESRNLDALEAILADPSYRLLRATDADQALHLLLQNDVAAIVLDIKMPGTSGLELAHLIKNTNRFRETPIVFLTAYLLDEQHITAGYDAGGVDYLTKPVNPQILRHKIAVFAELFRKTRELAALNKTLEERVHDRTVELERSEASLRAASRQKDEFLAVLAHELRNPLAPLRTGLDLLLRKESARPGEAKILTAMDRQLLHMVRLIDDLLDVSRISRGAIELKKEVVDLGVLVQTTVESARPLFERRRQDLVTTLARDVWVRADPTRTAQIVTNLLTNAAKFTPDGGTISVHLGREAGQVVVRIVDSGPGIPGVELERIFDMFTRLERPGAGKGAGLGIGLALARRLAEMHDGTLSASSEGAGRGATFALTLPALPAAAAPLVVETDEAARPSVSSGLKILVIEDNEDVAETLTMLLEDMGHEVSLARTGQGGIDLFRSTLPDVVLCDLGLPGMGGEEVCRQVRALPKAVEPVMVAITGWGRKEDRLRTREAGFDHHLVKPVTIASLDGVLGAVAT
jgi:signal transduction histidine kinase